MRALASAILLALAAVASSAPAQPAARPSLPLTFEKINARVYVSRGPSTSNNSVNGVIIGKTGVILFDTKNTQADERALLAKVREVTDKPITHVLISHPDGDHINGLPALPPGVEIIAQEAGARAWREAVKAGDAGAPDGRYLPSRTFSARRSLTIDGVRLQLLHYAPAHVAGDLILYLPDDKVVFMGDVLHTEIPEPFMHMARGGSPAGVLASIRGMTRLDADTYVSGHGPVVGKAEVLARLQRLSAKFERVRSLARQGRTLAQVREALGDPPPPPPTSGRSRFGSFTENIYWEATRGR